jgi:hypothetical protein
MLSKTANAELGYFSTVRNRATIKPFRYYFINTFLYDVYAALQMTTFVFLSSTLICWAIAGQRFFSLKVRSKVVG